MKKVFGIVGVLGVVVAACVAGVKTDKIVFGDDTEMTTAVSGSSVVTNTTTIQFSQGVHIDGDVPGYDTYIGKDEATDYALRTTDGASYNAYLSGEGAAGFFETTSGGFFVTKIGTADTAVYCFDPTYSANLVDTANNAAGYFSDGGRVTKLADGISAVTAQQGSLYAHLCDDTYAAAFQGGVYVMGAPAGFEVYMGVDEATDWALRTSDGTYEAKLSGDGYAGLFTDGTTTAYLGSSYGGVFTDGSDWAYLGGSGLAADFSGDVLNRDDVIMEMDDAAGSGTTWQEWAISDTKNSDGNWRMGVVNSNLVVQVRVSGVWTDATAFQRP